MKTSKHENVGSQFTLELCEIYHQLGFDCIWNDGKDLTLVEKEKDLPSGNLERSTI